MQLKKYAKYRESGIDWVGKIPEGWKNSKVKHLFSISKEKAYQKNPQILSLTKRGIIKRDISSNEGQVAESYEEYNKIKPGYIVLNTMDLISGFVDCSKISGVISPAYTTIKKINDADPEYFNYYFQKHYYEEIFWPFAEGVSIEHRWTLKNEDFLNFRIICPPNEDQNKISRFLEKKITDINKILTKVELLKNIFREKRLALIGEIILDQKTPKIRLKHITKSILRAIPKEKKETYVPLGLYNWGRGIFHKQLTEEEDLGESEFSFVKEGDLIFSGQFAWEGAIAIAMKEDAECIISHRYHIINGISERVNNEYLWAFFTSDLGTFILNQSSVGSAGRNKPLNINLLMKEKIPVPQLYLQEKIKKIVIKERKLSQLIKRLNKYLEEYKRSLIHHVVTGKVDVRGEN